MSAEKRLEALAHDVKSKCASLIDGAEALRKVPADARRRLLSLMVPQARQVAELLAAYEAETK